LAHHSILAAPRRRQAVPIDGLQLPGRASECYRMAVALMMRGASLEQGLFGCCSSCHAAFGEEFNAKSWASRERQYAFAGSGIPLPAALVSARGGDERSDWTPRAAFASGLPWSSQQGVPMVPPPSLLVDMPSGRSVPPLVVRDPAAKATERTRLRHLVQEFMQEAANGRSCVVVALDSRLIERSNTDIGSLRREARYILSEEVEKFTLFGRTLLQRKVDEHVANEQAPDSSEDQWEPLGQWPFEAVLGTHRAEESALVRSHEHDLTRIVTREEMGRAAVLEFGGGAFAGCVPLLLIEESSDHREKFVSGMQILRLYKGAALRAQRLESARSSSERRTDSPNSARVLASVPVASENIACTPTEFTAGTRSPAPGSTSGSAPGSARLNNVRVHRPLGMSGPEPPDDAGSKGVRTPTEKPPLSS